MSNTHKNKLNQTPFPLDGCVRVNQIIGDPKRGIAPFFPVSRSQWFIGIKQGIYPQGTKLSDRITVWKAEDVRKLVNELTHAVTK